MRYPDSSRCLLAVASLVLMLAVACSPLPSDWPIEELTLPKGSSVGAVPRQATNVREMLNRVPDIGPRLPLVPKWQVAFNNKGSWSSVHGSVSGQLSPLGYTEWKPGNVKAIDAQVEGLVGGQTFADVLKIFESADKKTVVGLINTSAMTAPGNQIDKEGAFVLYIVQVP